MQIIRKTSKPLLEQMREQSPNVQYCNARHIQNREFVEKSNKFENWFRVQKSSGCSNSLQERQSRYKFMKVVCHICHICKTSNTFSKIKVALVPNKALVPLFSNFFLKILGLLRQEQQVNNLDSCRGSLVKELFFAGPFIGKIVKPNTLLYH